MSKEDLNQTEDSKSVEEVTEEVVTEEEAVVETLEESLGTSDTPKDNTKNDTKAKDSVSLKKYLAEKKKRQDAEKQLSELQDVGDDEDDDDSDDLDVDQPSNDVTDRLAKLESDKKRAELNSKYDALYTTTMDANPEFKDIADKEVIKQLALNPANRSKTLPQILEQTYGKLLQGRPSIETDVSPTNPTPGKVDVDKARSDPTYFKEVMADPKMKAEYNESIQDRIIL